MDFSTLVAFIFQNFWPHIVTAGTVVLMLWAAGHVILVKKDTKAASGWLALIWFSPLVGACMYWLFGINRIKRRARSMFAGKKNVFLPRQYEAVTPERVAEQFSVDHSSIALLSRLTENITRQPLMDGNRVELLVNGDQAYPAMLEAIRGAKRSITLSTYIFDHDDWGAIFRRELAEAVGRDVAVRVLIDAVGARYSFPSIVSSLKRDNIPCALFMRTILPWRFRYNNLRNHRKILVVDGCTGFTGGMNIRDGHFLADEPNHPIQDVHFRLRGSVVAELQRSFAEDWNFTTGEWLEGPIWFPRIGHYGDCIARGIADGPDEDFDKLRMVMLGALAAARSSIMITTPYFLPDSELFAELQLAALRGADVQILLPAENNLLMVQWASAAGLRDLLVAGCRIFLTPPPFDHSKLFTVDEQWSLLGSANWDPRSLALSFEFNVECYEHRLAREMNKLMAGKAAVSEELTVEKLDSRPLVIRLRNNLLRLFSPYL